MRVDPTLPRYQLKLDVLYKWKLILHVAQRRPEKYLMVILKGRRIHTNKTTRKDWF